MLTACSQTFDAKISSSSNESDLIVCPEAYEVSMDYFISMLAKQNSSEKISEMEFKANLKFNDLESQITFYQIYNDFYSDILRLSAEEKNDNLMELAAQLKVEDAESELRKAIVLRTKEKIYQLSGKLKNKGMECSGLSPNPYTPVPDVGEVPKQGDPGEPTPPNPQPQKSEIRKAMDKVLAVSYQSCEVLYQKPLTLETANVEGIKEECCHDDGIGKLRTISSLKDLLKTHYYLQAPMFGSQCFPINSNPLIYDYGGRPSYTMGAEGKLNFFKNQGGTKVLGYDCSALVYTVLLGAGYRLTPNKPFVASDVIAAQSRQFINPDLKDWACLERITLTPSQTLEVGDIASLSGHVLMVHSIGKDPLGINDLANCQDVRIANFDFTVFQSSPSKNGIGINIYEAKDYLSESDSMAEIFLDYAKNACLSKKLNKNIQLKRSEYSIIRHKKTPECRMKPVRFENETCVVGKCI